MRKILLLAFFLLGSTTSALGAICAAKIEDRNEKLPNGWRALTLKSDNASELNRGIDVLRLSQTAETYEYQRFINYVSSNDQMDPYKILRRDRWSYRFMEPIFKAVLDDAIGRISAVKCWEALLFNRFNSEHPQIAEPGEFGALLLERGRELKIYFLSTVKFGLSVKDLGLHLVGDRKDGWSFEVFLHSHPFHLKDGTLIGGQTIPSPADVLEQKRLKATYGLLRSAITNGISTVSFNAAEIDRLPNMQ